MQEEKSILEQASDLAEELSADIGNLAGTACLLWVDLDDSNKIYPIHRQTMGTIRAMLERLEADSEKLTDYLAKLQHAQQGKMQRDVVVIPTNR